VGCEVGDEGDFLAELEVANVAAGSERKKIKIFFFEG
jgi:hypothetical protein